MPPACRRCLSLPYSLYWHYLHNRSATIPIGTRLLSSALRERPISLGLPTFYSVVGDMFPKSTIATIVGIGGMAGGISSFLINMGSGRLFDYAAQTNMKFMGFEGKPAGYFIIFCICAVAYLLGWIIMKILVPKYKPVDA